MNCIICNDDCDKYDGKVWITLKNEKYFDTYKTEVHYCSYQCFHRNRDNLPKDHWKNVLNKEDFDCPLPVVPKNETKRFEYLTYSEYINLTDIEKNDYESNKEMYQFLNPESSLFYNEQYNEDKRTHALETMDTDSECSVDDY